MLMLMNLVRDQETWDISAAKDPENARSGFVTLCHGEPWSGNVQYRYSSFNLVNNNNNHINNKNGIDDEEGKTPVEAVFGGMLCNW